MQVSIHKNNKINLPALQKFLAGVGKGKLRSTLWVNALYWYGDVAQVVTVGLLVQL
jgi:hypothetical protein